MKLWLTPQLTETRIAEIRAYYDACHNHEQTRKEFGLTYAQEHAINIIGRDYHLTEAQLAARMPAMHASTEDPDEIALALLDDRQYIAYMERRYGR